MAQHGTDLRTDCQSATRSVGASVYPVSELPLRQI